VVAREARTTSEEDMRTLLGALTLVIAAVPAMAQTPPPAPPPVGCSTAGLPAPQIKLVGGKFVHVRPLATVLDAAIDDFGQSGGSDALSVYCVTGTANAARGSLAMCLTGERCPWR
jgi:hypothetical protein